MPRKDAPDRIVIPRPRLPSQPRGKEEPLFPGLLDAMSTPLWSLSQRQRIRSAAMFPVLAVLLFGVPAAIGWLLVTGPLAWVPVWFVLAGGAVWYAISLAKLISYLRSRR